ncbi:MAG: N-acetylglucosamine-6-phosphate deacetylase [Bacteroidetes bacterium]|nr:MAG: N-acetylglucosamine-6-phosphate deacetylase [Bacteroidota bacterium]
MKTTSFALRNVRIITPFRIVEPGVIVIAGRQIAHMGKVSDIAVPPGIPVYDLPGITVTPGFIDLLVHGGYGHGFADDTADAITAISDFFFAHGTTGLLASLFSKKMDLLKKDMTRIADYIEGHTGSNVWGIHMEGPFINPQIKGAHKIEYLWEPNVEMWNELYASSRGHIKLMTISPELPGNIDVIRTAASQGVVPSIGHTLALYDDIEKAIDNGAAHVTHMFNAMRPFHHREAGIMVAALLRNELKVELIADGIHVNPIVMKLLHNIKGSGGIILVTDAIRASGMPDGEYHFMDQKIIVREKRAFLENGTLAGSTLTMEEAVKTMVKEVGVPLTDAVRMASLNGAKVLGIEHRKGILAVGKDADLVLLDDGFNVQATVYEGEVKYQRSLFKH